jgi:hypothetical protein
MSHQVSWKMADKISEFKEIIVNIVRNILGSPDLILPIIGLAMLRGTIL